MDIVDQYQAEQEVYRRAALLARAPEGPKAAGVCLHCGEALPSGRWCDADCRDDWQRANPQLRPHVVDSGASYAPGYAPSGNEDNIRVEWL